MSLPPNPFPGPVPLRETDQLFSRKRETAELIGRIVDDRLGAALLALGRRKSSLLNAGVLRAMRKRGLRTHDVSFPLDMPHMRAEVCRLANGKPEECARLLGAASK